MTVRTSDIVIRRARPADAAALRRLARLDDRRLPRGELLVAEVEGEIRAAVGLADGAAIADPWQLTADLVELLRLPASRAAAEAAAPRRRILGRPAPAAAS
jgi:hypothetical protein